MKPFALVTLLAAFTAATAAAETRAKMTDEQKIQWYCERHQDEGDNCEAHARLLLPYISDYAQYDGVDTRGQEITVDPNGCDFSPMPDGCPNARVSGGSDPSGGSGSAGGLPLPPARGCTTAERDGVSWTICWNLAAMPQHQGGHGGMTFANSQQAYSVGFLPGGGNYSCTTIDTPGFVGQGCSGRMWISGAPGGPALAGCESNLYFGGASGGSINYSILGEANAAGCELRRDVRQYCNVALTMSDADWVGWVPDESGTFDNRRRRCGGVLNSPLGTDSYVR